MIRMGRDRHKCLGFDAGSSSWKISVLDDERLIWTAKIPTETISKDANVLRSVVDQHKAGLAAIAAPSGLGLPLTTVDRIGDPELRLMTLRINGSSIVGLRKGIQTLKEIQGEIGVRCFIFPSVKHLPTVPTWRKINRIDLGTADKLCAAAHALQRLAERTATSYREISFILGEVGHSFVGLICVKKGRIVDGIGGTNASFGTGAPGGLDAELVHIWSFPDKPSIYTGGLVHAAGASLDAIETSLSGAPSPRVKIALTRFSESLASDAVAMASRNGVRTFVLSSALGPLINRNLERAARRVGLNVIKDINDEMSASVGAAYLANGLVGGRYRGLSNILALEKSRGSVFDDIFLEGKSRLAWLKGDFA